MIKMIVLWLGLGLGSASLNSFAQMPAEPLAGKEPLANEEPLANKEPLAAKEPSGDEKPLALLEANTPQTKTLSSEVLLKRLQLNLNDATPSWMGKPAKSSYAKLLLNRYTQNNAGVELFALMAEQPSSHYSALFSKMVNYQLLSDSGYWCTKPTNDTDYQKTAYLLWLQGDLAKPSWNMLEQASQACKPSQQQAATVTENAGAISSPTYTANEMTEEISLALISYQARNGLKQSGSLDTQTLEMLGKSPEELVRVMQNNLGRMRELNGQLGERYLLANIPAFQATVYHDNEPTLRLNTIVGKRSRPTPQFSTNLTTIVVNPGWNVPSKLMYKDLIPKQVKNPDYLSSKGIGIYANWQSTEAIDPATIDWQARRWDFPYRMRQAPGPKNALGRYKFITPNPRAIFMHDTNAKKLFSRDVRAFSSGCVRLEQPERLAEYLLAHEGRQKQMQKIRAMSSTRWVDLKEDLPVHYVYWTAWVDHGGTLQFRNDIYQHDKNDLAPPLYAKQ